MCLRNIILGEIYASSFYFPRRGKRRHSERRTLAEDLDPPGPLALSPGRPSDSPKESKVIGRGPAYLHLTGHPEPRAVDAGPVPSSDTIHSLTYYPLEMF